MEITIDTHSLVWYLDKSLNNKLSKEALSTIKKAEKDGIIYIPVIVLIEILHLVEKGRISQDFNKLVSTLEESENYFITPLDVSLLSEVEKIKGLETHDRIIMATAKFNNTPLVSKDEVIRDHFKDVIGTLRNFIDSPIKKEEKN